MMYSSKLVFCLSLFACLAGIALFLTQSGEAFVGPDHKVSIEDFECQPGFGWTWARGDSQPIIASRMELVLESEGIYAAVSVMEFGEVDSCDLFQGHGIDIEIELVGDYPISSDSQNQLMQSIYSLLDSQIEGMIGQVKLIFPSGDIVVFDGSVPIYPETAVPDLLNRGATTTDIDATLTWQNTPLMVQANQVVTVNVSSGTWTHRLGVEPYNAGTGGGYTCHGAGCSEPLPGTPQGALIGRIGTYIFPIGNGTSIVSPQSGQLQVRINDPDNGLFDNDGLLTLALSAMSIEPLAQIERDVYVIVYDPLLSNGSLLSEHMGWHDHATLTQGTINFFKQVSNDQVRYQVAYTTVVTSGWPIKRDGFQYSEAEYLAVMAQTTPGHSPDAVDYNVIVNDSQFDICGRANRGEIDEVWIYNGPYFGFYESTLVGPNGYWFNSGPVPGDHDCQRLIPIMGPNPERGLNSAIHNFGHRTESTMREVYGSWVANRTDHSWERYTLLDVSSADYGYSGCGNTHYPPNGSSDYDYGNMVARDTNCDDFFYYPNLDDPGVAAKPIICLEWGCTELGYHDYWYRHFPSTAGCDADGVLNHWWVYFIEPSLALTPTKPCSFYRDLGFYSEGSVTITYPLFAYKLKRSSAPYSNFLAVDQDGRYAHHNLADGPSYWQIATNDDVIVDEFAFFSMVLHGGD